MIIRDFHIEDINKGLTEVYKEVWAITTITPTIINEYLKNDNHMIIAETEGKIIGTLTLHIQKKLIRDGGIAALIEDFAVKNNYRGSNIGSKMLEYAITKASELGCYKIILSCHPERFSFYERNKFIKESTTMRYNLL
jgi:glucosamine-phosphate N-acetyltransferase